jgi:hypothetical protein
MSSSQNDENKDKALYAPPAVLCRVKKNSAWARILNHSVEVEKSTFQEELSIKGQSVQQGSQWLQFLCIDFKDHFVLTVKKNIKII